MDYDTLLKIIKRRRSVRSYQPGTVPLEDVMKVLEAARWAPSGNNSQPWEFVVVRDKDKLQQITDIFVEQSQRLRDKSINFQNAPNKSYLEKVSTLILVCADPRFKRSYPQSNASEEMRRMFWENSERIYIQTVTAVICNIILAATALRLGTVWLTGAGEDITAQQLKAALKIPQVLDVICCIPLGPYRSMKDMAYHDQFDISHRTPRPLETMVHIDEFDTGKWRTDEQAERFIQDKHTRAKFFKTGLMD
jgi:nitroreductase